MMHLATVDHMTCALLHVCRSWCFCIQTLSTTAHTCIHTLCAANMIVTMTNRLLLLTKVGKGGGPGQIFPVASNASRVARVFDFMMIILLRCVQIRTLVRDITQGRQIHTALTSLAACPNPKMQRLQDELVTFFKQGGPGYHDCIIVLLPINTISVVLTGKRQFHPARAWD